MNMASPGPKNFIKVHAAEEFEEEDEEDLNPEAKGLLDADSDDSSEEDRSAGHDRHLEHLAEMGRAAP